VVACDCRDCNYERCREHLVKAAARNGLKLRQNYNREAPRLGLQIGRYAHAKQYKRMRKALRTLRSRVGREMRDVERQVAQVADSGRAALLELIGQTKRILAQKAKDKTFLLRCSFLSIRQRLPSDADDGQNALFRADY
jgi:transposase, IS5 family